MEQLLPSYRPPRELPGPLPGVIRTNAPTGGSQRVRRKPHLDRDSRTHRISLPPGSVLRQVSARRLWSYAHLPRFHGGPESEPS